MIRLHLTIAAVLSAVATSIERWASWHRASVRVSRQLVLPLERMTTGRSRVVMPRRS